MPLTTRAGKGAPLTHAEMDGNLTFLDAKTTSEAAAAVAAHEAASDPHPVYSTSTETAAAISAHTGSATAHAAASITNSPAGNIAATSVQAAINELDSEKAALTGATFSGAISASNLSGTNTGDQTITLTGDVTGTGTGSISATLATVSVAKGGTGNTSTTAYAVQCGGTTSTGAHQPVASVGTAGQVLTSNGASALPSFQNPSAGGLTEGTEVATTSGTAHAFTGLPAGIRRIIFALREVSTNGSSLVQVQLSTGGIFKTSGYIGGSGDYVPTANFTSLSGGFLIGSTGFVGAGNARHGHIVLTRASPGINTWNASGTFAASNTALTGNVAGSVTLTGVLDGIRITTVNGTDAFDAGAVNIMYE